MRFGASNLDFLVVFIFVLFFKGNEWLIKIIRFGKYSPAVLPMVLNHHQHKSQAANLIVIVKPNFNLNTYLVSEWKADSVAGIWLCKCGKVASTKQNLGNHILQKRSIDRNFHCEICDFYCKVSIKNRNIMIIL